MKTKKVPMFEHIADKATAIESLKSFTTEALMDLGDALATVDDHFGLDLRTLWYLDAIKRELAARV